MSVLETDDPFADTPAVAHTATGGDIPFGDTPQAPQDHDDGDDWGAQDADDDAWLNDEELKHHSLEVLFRARPIRDGSQVLRHDGYDVRKFSEALDDFPNLATFATTASTRLITARALLADIFFSFFRAAPVIDPITPLTPPYRLHERILAQLITTNEWQRLRAAGTPGDAYNSAVATLGAAQSALDALDNATVQEINHLHALELGADDLFAQAEALDEEGAQAEGDRAAALFAQAQRYRTQAEAHDAQAEASSAALLTNAEAIEDATRRAARQGMQAVEGEIAQLNTAIRSFAGGYGPGAGLGATMTAKEKIALATQVQRSHRLKQIAAICGRMTRIALNTQATKVQHDPDEIASVKTGRDLERLLPSELALLASPATALLFAKKFAEGELLSYDLVRQEKQGQGPIICAVDTSGSMEGTKDIHAKAVLLALMAIARLQQRDIAIMLFSSPGELAVFEFPKGQGDHQSVIACVETFYGGGTVFEPWMERAVQIAEQAQYKRADVICITDGLTEIRPAARAAFNTTRQGRDMRAYGILIGTTAGAGALASVTDAVLSVDSLADDSDTLATIFSI